MKLLLCLVLTGSVWAEENRLPINPELKTTEKGEFLWQGDIVLNQDQVNRIFDPFNTRKAHSDETKRWYNGVVPFYISESSKSDRDVILSGLEHWMDNTCLQFVEILQPANYPHLNFMKGASCYAEVGMNTTSNGQDVSIGDRCEYMGTVAHEVGHAIGLWHEFSRTDRDQHLWILLENVTPKSEYNFNIEYLSKTYDVPYDFTSLMHYESKAFSKNNLPTILPKDVTKVFDLEAEKRLSFFDIMMVTKMYHCDAKCTYKPECKNEGFVDHTCRCRCPAGFSGHFCQTAVAIPGKCGGTFNYETTIVSLYYPYGYPANTKCVWAFEAPRGKRVKVHFHDFNLNPTEDGYCSGAYLEVRNTDLYKNGIYEGTFYCGNTLHEGDTVSEGNTLALLFKSYKQWSSGFRADVTFV